MFEYMVLVVGGVILLSIIGVYDTVTKKGKRAMTRLLVGSTSVFFVVCVLGSYFDVSNPKTALPGSCEVLSSSALSGERTMYHLRNLANKETRFTREYKKGDFPPSGYRLVSLEGRELLLREN